MISLTMSRISSRADFGVELGELRKVDRVDQRVEDRRLDLVVVSRNVFAGLGRWRPEAAAHGFIGRNRRRGDARRVRFALFEAATGSPLAQERLDLRPGLSSASMPASLAKRHD